MRDLVMRRDLVTQNWSESSCGTITLPGTGAVGVDSIHTTKRAPATGNTQKHTSTIIVYIVLHITLAYIVKYCAPYLLRITSIYFRVSRSPSFSLGEFYGLYTPSLWSYRISNEGSCPKHIMSLINK
jgi:hypothetical protein